MFGHIMRSKQGGAKLFAFFTILFIAGAIWAYFLLYLPAMDEKYTKASEIRKLINDAEDYLSQSDYLNALEIIETARTLENLDSVYNKTLNTLETQALVLEFKLKSAEASKLMDADAIADAQEVLNELRIRINEKSSLKSVLGEEKLQKLADLENKHRLKELDSLLSEIGKFVKLELFNNAAEKIQKAQAILKIVKASEDFNRDEYTEKLENLKRENDQLSIKEKIREIELLAANEVYVDAYEKIQEFDDKYVADELKQKLQELRQICEERISSEIFIKIESLLKAEDLYKAVEMVEMADLFNFQQSEILEKIKTFRTDIDGKIKAITNSTAEIITKAQKAIENKQYEEALKIIKTVKLDSVIVDDQRQDIALFKSQANINLEYAKIQYDPDAYFVDRFITIEVRTIAGVEYFGQMIEDDYNLLKNPPENSTDENSKVIIYTNTLHHDDRAMIMLDLSEIADFIPFTVSEVDESVYKDEIKEWKSDIRISHSKVDEYKLAKYWKSVSNKPEDIEQADYMIESLTRYDFSLWQTLELRRSDIFKTCITNIVMENLADAKKTFKTILKLYPFAESIWRTENKSFDERFDVFKQKIKAELNELDTFDLVIELNAFQKKLIENDESGVINYADNAYSLAMKQLKNLNKYGITSVRQLRMAEYYCKLAMQMLYTISDKNDKEYDKIDKINKDLYLIKILSEY